MLKYNFSWVLILFLTLFTSCITNKDSLYLQQDVENIPNYTAAESNAYKLKIGDQLHIKIESILQEENGLLGGGGNGMRQNFTSDGAIYLESYEVYEDGNIDYPFLGKIAVAGKSLREIRLIFNEHLKDYLASDAKVTVKLVNANFSVIGEVKRGGRFNLYQEYVTIFDALAMAGDLTNFGDRRKIKVVRNVNGTPVVKEFDLRTKELLGSDYYYIQPGDIIYVSKVRGQFFRMDNFSTGLTMVTSSLSFLLLVMNYVN